MVERRNKWTFLYIFVLFVVLICSAFYSPQKTNAVELTQNVNFITSWNTYYNITAGVGNCQYTNTGTTGYAYAPPNGNGACSPLIRILSPSLNGLGFNNDYIFSVPIYVYEYRDREPINNYANSSPIMTITNNGTEIYGQFIGWSSTTFSESSAVVYAYFKFNAGQVSLNSGATATITPYIAIKENEYMTTGPIGIFSKQNLSVVADFSGVITELQINNQWNETINTNLQRLIQNINNNQSTINNIDNSVQNIENNFEQQQQDQQQQGLDSQDNSNQAGQDVEQSTTNLLSFITGFFGAFTSATATSCVTDWGVEGFRHFDFCATEIPVQLRVVFTIVSAVVFVPMVWFLISSILKAFKEFQEG